MAANDRQELEELRRLDELEAKAAGRSTAPKGTDLETKAQTMTAEETPEWERRAAAVGRSMSAPFESAGQVYSHLTGSGKEADAAAQERARAMQALEKASAKDAKQRQPVVPRSALNLPANVIEDILTKVNAGRTGTATDITTGMLAPVLKIPGVSGLLGRLLSGGLTGGAYGGLSEPVVTGGDFTTEKAKQVGKSAAGGLLTTGVFEGLSKIPGMFKKTPPVERIASESTQGVTGEMQRIRDVMEGRADPKVGAGASEFERAKVDFDETMKTMRNEVFSQGGTVNPTGTVSLIDKLTAKNPDKQVRAALKEVRDTIGRGTESVGAANLPAAGAKVTPAQLRAMRGQGDNLDLPMLDEVRQSINRMIEQKGEGALSGHTKDILAQVRASLVADTPKGYKDYLSQFGTGTEELKKYAPEATVIGKITDKRTNPVDAMADIFGGKSNIADLTSLVDHAKHDPKVLGDVQKSLGEWLTRADPQTKVVSTSDILNRWDKVRGAAEKSGLMPADHVKMVDSLVDDLIKVKSKKGMEKDVATVGGFFAGMVIGHPFMTSHFARDIASDTSMKKVQQNATNIIMSLAVGDVEAARLLSAKPTAANMSAFQQRIEQMLAMGAGREAAQGEPPRKRRMDQLIGGFGGR